MKYKKSGRVMALLLSAVLTLCLLPLPVSGRGDGAFSWAITSGWAATTSEPILWRCVSVDENGRLDALRQGTVRLYAL